MMNIDFFPEKVPELHMLVMIETMNELAEVCCLTTSKSDATQPHVALSRTSVGT